MIKLDQPYSLGLFQDILESLFGDNAKIFDVSRVVNQKGYWKYITRMDRIGEQSDLEVQFYVVEHRGLSDPRVSLTKEIFRTLSEAGHRRALVAIYHTNSSTWRLSLVTMTLDIDNHGKLTREYSNARRYSFLLGEDEKTRTPSDSLLKKGKITDLSDLISRFSVEVVRKEFFEDYIDAFIRLYKAIESDHLFAKNLLDNGVDQVKFTKNLLGKIIFIYFIQKKGWLGLGKDEKWGQGDKNFMRSLWDRFISGDIFVRPSTGNFYNDYLEHLFYNGFNKDRRDDDAYEPNMRMKVPYLNGGLFREDYRNWEYFDAKISNDIFSNSKNTGILDIFDIYNFTIDEDDLFDSEIAVDPEMLGKIFEKMVSVSKDNIVKIVDIYLKIGKIDIGKELNKQFGAYYTPRHIVQYMTRESLISYLSNGLQGKRDDNESKIRLLLSSKDRHLSKNGDIISEADLNTLLSVSQDIDLLLQKVKILDPAVGSGAFPMGILHEISTLRYYLHSEGFCTTHHHEDDDQTEDFIANGHISMYRIKRDTIKNSVFGVDIDPGAIDIARLRFWLSLVVDAETPEPLPNFEFKFIAANTLVPLDQEIEDKQLSFDLGGTEVKLRTLRRYMTDYYNADTKLKKMQLEERILNYVTLDGTKDASQTSLKELSSVRRIQLAEFRPFDVNYSNPFFDPSLMLGEGRGFDIIIGNPPYISYYSKQSQGNEKVTGMLENFKKYYNFITDKKKLGRYNTVMFFLERASRLAKSKGTIQMIIDTNFYSNPFFDIRKYLLETCDIKEIVTNIDAFEGVGSKQVIIKFSNKTTPNNDNLVSWKEIILDNFIFLVNILQSVYINSNEIFLPKSNSEDSLRNKIEKNIQLQNILRKENIRTCITFTGQKDKFVFPRKELDMDYPLLEGSKGLRGPYHNITYDNYVRYDIALRDKLNKDYIQLAISTGKRTPMVIGLGSLAHFSAPKLFIRLSDTRVTATYTEEFVCADLSLYVLTLPNMEIQWDSYHIFYFLGLLNSKLITYYARTFDKIGNLGKGTPQIRLKDIRELPIKTIDFRIQRESLLHNSIVDNVKKMLDLKKLDTLEFSKNNEEYIRLNNEINNFIYQLYDIEENDILIIDKSLM